VQLSQLLVNPVNPSAPMGSPRHAFHPAILLRKLQPSPAIPVDANGVKNELTRFSRLSQRQLLHLNPIGADGIKDVQARFSFLSHRQML
jgi:hypothetical protein